MSNDQIKVLAKFKPNKIFVFHTLTRVCAETLKVGYPDAEKFAHGLIESGMVVESSKIGLANMKTFKLSDQ